MPVYILEKNLLNAIILVAERPFPMEVIIEDISLFIAKISLSRLLLMLMATGVLPNVLSTIAARKWQDLVEIPLFEVIFSHFTRWINVHCSITLFVNMPFFLLFIYYLLLIISY